MVRFVPFVEFRLFERFAAGAGHDQSDMGAAGGLIVGHDDVSVLQDGDARGAAADVDDGAVAKAQQFVRGGGFVQKGRHFEAGGFRDVLHGASVQRVGARRDGCRREVQFGVHDLFEPLLHGAHQPDGAHVVDDHAVPDDVRVLVRAGDGLTVFVEDREDDTGRAEVDAGQERGRSIARLSASRVVLPHLLPEALELRVGVRQAHLDRDRLELLHERVTAFKIRFLHRMLPPSKTR